MSYVYAWADSKACKFPSVDTVFELNQDSGEQPVISAIRNLDTTTVTINVLGNKLNTGNAEYYEEFLNTLSSENVTEITNVKNTYKIFIDAVIYDAKRSILEEGIKIHNIDASDTVRLLEVDRNGNCEYIPQKRFNLHVPYTFPVVRTGITSARKTPRYIRIRNITIMAEVDVSGSNGIKKLNQTLLDKTISPVSPTIQQAKSDMIEIFNSYDINFGVIDLINPPRTIDLELDITIEGFVHTYDENDINQIIQENINNGETPTDPPDEPDEPGPDDPDNPGCGCGCDENNYFAQFERCSKDDMLAGIVVTDTEYNSGTHQGLCYAYSTVAKDIADIKVGEYVKYVESIIITCL